MKLIFVLLALVTAVQAHAQVAVTPHPNQSVLLQSSDPQLARNKALSYDFFRIVLRGRRLDRAADFLAEEYIQHNPNVPTGRQGFIDFFTRVFGGQTRPIPDDLPGLVAVQAEADFVTLSFVDTLTDSTGLSYTTTWFDMFRIANDRIVEHWDNDVIEAR